MAARGASIDELIEAARDAGICVPAILITAFGDTETHERASALGETTVLDKPLRVAELVAIARKVTRTGHVHEPS